MRIATMALVTCKECGGKVSASAEKCPHCGRDNPGLSNATNSALLIITGIIGIIIGLLWLSMAGSF